jgi:CRISPR-associated protein Cas2
VSSERTHRYLVAYDIASDLRRNRIAHALESYGDRIQFSVFIIDINPAKLVRLRTELRKHLDLSEDHALICDLGPLSVSPRQIMEFIGHPPSITSHGPLVI